ncbi:MAG: precorrin-6y C5,15-methyltransferase (decarboxylating) subunit CbiE [Oscillospiraceae bacterium]
MNISIIGTGVGSDEFIFPKAIKTIDNADLIIGAKRLTQSICNNAKQVLNLINAKDIYDAIIASDAKNIAILMSGDIGFYSGTKSLLPYLKDFDVEVIPGISSVQFFSSKLKMPWQNWKLASAHGVDCNIYSIVNRNKESFFLTGGKWTINEICKYLSEWNFENLHIYIGENLGSETEKISYGIVKDFVNINVSDLAVCLIINENATKQSTFSILDDDFIRGNIPMTKQEVRSIILAKMKVKSDDIIYDIGAGTGSVSVELALAAYDGKVFAIEREAEGVELIKINAKKHSAYNLSIVEGNAPAELEGLPIPNAAFIGGSGGNLYDIVKLLLDKNPQIRLVITTVTLETLNEVLELLKTLELNNSEIVQVMVSRSKKLGNYHLMMGQNPIYIISVNC